MRKKKCELRIENGELEKYTGNIKKLVLPDTVTSIRDGALKQWLGGGTKEIVIPGSIKRIGRGAVQMWDLEEMTLCDGIERIESYAFQNCSNLRVVRMPGTLKYMGPEAFYLTHPEEVIFPPNLNCRGLSVRGPVFHAGINGCRVEWPGDREYGLKMMFVRDRLPGHVTISAPNLDPEETAEALWPALARGYVSRVLKQGPYPEAKHRESWWDFLARYILSPGQENWFLDRRECVRALLLDSGGKLPGQTLSALLALFTARRDGEICAAIVESQRAQTADSLDDLYRETFGE